MDERRIDTAGFLAMGGLNRPVPETDIPRDRERVEWEEVRGEVAQALDAGKVVSACNYYGIPYVWRDAEGAYRGILLQYRAVTEDVTFTSCHRGRRMVRRYGETN